MEKSPSVKQETCVQPLGQEDPWNTGLRLLSLERPAYKWPLDAFWEFDWHIGPDTDGTLFLNDKDGS